MPEPISQQYRKSMNAVAQGLDKIFNGESRGKDKKTGFVLLVFEFGNVDGSRVNYISNGADRKEMVSVMKEIIARFEGQPETTGHA
jgi:hypothetical protein